MEIIKSLLSDFDVASLLPKLDVLLSKVALLARIVVMAGPVILLVLGLWYLLLPPREANHAVGYRFFWGMSSIESWEFTQLTAGIVWSGLGLILSVVMYLLSGSFGNMELMAVVWKTVEFLFWEMGLIVLSCLVIDLTVVFTFNSKGDRRKERPAGNKTEAEIVEEEVKHFVHNVNEKLHQKPDLEKAKAMGTKLLPKKEVPAVSAPAVEAVAVSAEEPVAPEVIVEEELVETSAAEALRQEEAQNTSPAAPSSRQHKNPHGSKKRYPNGTRKKGKK